jgi:intracellular septation protein A
MTFPQAKSNVFAPVFGTFTLRQKSDEFAGITPSIFGTLSQKLWLISLLIMKRKRIHPME